jgi:hypothetical protein
MDAAVQAAIIRCWTGKDELDGDGKEEDGDDCPERWGGMGIRHILCTSLAPSILKLPQSDCTPFRMPPAT